MNGEERDWRVEARALAQSLSLEGIGARVAEAIARVPRHLFVPADLAHRAYEDSALPIGCDQTISQPFVVAYMTELLDVHRGERVLEVGTGSGYQTAVLAELGAQVYSIEVVPELSLRAEKVLKAVGYGSVHLCVGDGAEGWPGFAPYDGVIVTAASDGAPPALIDQLAVGRRVVIPIEDEDSSQSVWRMTKRTDGRVEGERMLAVRFVPMVRRTKAH